MTTFSQILDRIPVVGVFVLLCAAALCIYALGLRVGRWRKQSSSDGQAAESPLVGPLVGMLAFLLAVTMGMASDRFSTRRGIILDEANSIGTTFLRAGYLAEPYRKDIQNMLREYVPLRIASSDMTQLAAAIARSKELHGRLWTQTEVLVHNTHDSPTLALFVESLNELIDLHTTRVIAGIYSRVPQTVILLLLVGTIMTMGVVGYNAGLTKPGSTVTTVVLIVALGAVITLVIDLDRPREGFLQVSQQPLTELHEELGDPR
jgi:hypothetical protein